MRQGEKFAGKAPEWVFQTGPRESLTNGCKRE